MSSLVSKVYTLSSAKNLFLKEESVEIEKSNNDYIIAETIYSCISPGTEVAAYDGMKPLRAGNPYPRVVGYCNVARVIGIGKNVGDVSIGNHILTFQSHRDKFIITSSEFYLVLPPEIELKYACTAYLFHLGYHSLITAELKQGHTLAIIGAGVLGVSTSLMGNIAGANTYLFSNQVGGSNNKNTHIKYFNKSDRDIDAALNATSITGFDVVVNTSNSWEDWLIALKLIRKGGVIVNLGFPGRGQGIPMYNPLEPQYVYSKNITIKALCFINETDTPVYDVRFNMKRNLHYILSLFQSGKLNPMDLLTDEITFQELEAQYQKYLNRKIQMLSTIIKWKD
jgi:threonine dehydrogenase-like Zn-dependent dehydrogenase